MTVLKSEADNISPDKSLGQHFLRDPNIIRKIVSAIQIFEGETIVEIGPGPGALTVALVSERIHVIALEKDARFQGILEASTRSRVGTLDFRLCDALKIDWSEVVPSGAKVVGNLPYNVGTHIVLNILQQKANVGVMTFMLQKEVVQRFMAAPGTPERGRISIWRELLADGESLFDVSCGAFNPPPKVTSAVMRLKPLKQPRYDVDIPALKIILNTTFNQRRKMVRASLRDMLTLEQIVDAGVDPAARPEVLTTEQFCRLAHQLTLSN